MTDYSVKWRCEAALRDDSRCMRRARWMTATGWLCRQHRDQAAGLLKRKRPFKAEGKRFPQMFLP